MPTPGDDSAADGLEPAPAGTTERNHGYDPPPSWDGVEPARRWLKIREDLQLWHDDTDLPARKHGTRLYRHLGEAARDAVRKGVKQDDIRGEDGFNNTIYQTPLVRPDIVNFGPDPSEGYRHRIERFRARAAGSTRHPLCEGKQHNDALQMAAGPTPLPMRRVPSPASPCPWAELARPLPMEPQARLAPTPSASRPTSLASRSSSRLAARAGGRNSPD